MAAQEDTEPKDRQAPAASPGNTKDDGRKPGETKDPDVYDPVGMAGQRAGIVEELAGELEQEARDPRPEPGKEASPSKRSAPTSLGSKKDQD